MRHQYGISALVPAIKYQITLTRNLSVNSVTFTLERPKTWKGEDWRGTRVGLARESRGTRVGRFQLPNLKAKGVFVIFEQ